MRLLASTGPMFAQPLDWALAVLAEAGYDGAELMVTQDVGTQDPEQVAAAADREGVPISAVHGPFLLVTRRVFGTEPVAKARRSLELAGAVGADVMIVHPPYRWQRAFHRWLVDEADDEAARHGTRVGVENLYPVTIGQRPVRFHRYTTAEHLAPFHHVVLDTSHLGVAGEDLLGTYLALREQVGHLHVSDHRGGPRDSHAPLGHGRLPLGALLHQLGQDERAGVGSVGRGRTAMTLELDCRRYLDDRAALVGFLRQERSKAEALLAGADPEEILGRPDIVAVAPGYDEDDADQPTVGPDGT